MAKLYLPRQWRLWRHRGIQTFVLEILWRMLSLGVESPGDTWVLTNAGSLRDLVAGKQTLPLLFWLGEDRQALSPSFAGRVLLLRAMLCKVPQLKVWHPTLPSLYLTLIWGLKLHSSQAYWDYQFSSLKHSRNLKWINGTYQDSSSWDRLSRLAMQNIF